MESKDIVTGKIKQGDLKVSFVGEDHRFVFLPSKYTPRPIIFNDEIGVLEPDNDFLKGQTFFWSVDMDILSHPVIINSN